MSTQDPCPCGSDLDYAACCQPRHLGLRPAETAEALMRSRFSAHARGLTSYLATTLHPSARRPENLDSRRRETVPVRWTGLRILDVDGGGEGDDGGFVEFVAFFVRGDRSGELHERSRFARLEGRWFYVDGGARPRYRPPSKRAKCWCGSGRTYRTCDHVS